MEETKVTIGVYCSSSTQIDTSFFDAARTLGRAIGERGMRCCNGGGGIGLMGAISDAVMQSGGEAIGVIPEFMVQMGWHHGGLTELRVVPDMHSRKALMAELSSAVVALPGGIGTLEELLEILTWKQLGLFNKPIIILNLNGFYEPLLAQLDQAVSGQFMRAEHTKMWQVVTDANEVLAAIEHATPWDSNCRKIAAI